MPSFQPPSCQQTDGVRPWPALLVHLDYRHVDAAIMCVDMTPNRACELVRCVRPRPFVSLVRTGTRMTCVYQTPIRSRHAEQ